MHNFAFIKSICLIIIFATSINIEANASIFSVKLKIDVQQKSCNVYGVDGPGQPIIVDFGDINSAKYNNDSSVKYAKQIDYNIDCGAVNNDGLNLKLSFESKVASFNNSYVGTSNDELGIKLTANNSLLEPYNYVNFKLAQKPILIAIPIINNSEKIKLGSFNATGTLKVEYP